MEECQVAEINTKEAKEGKVTSKADQEEDDLWESFGTGVKVEREDIDPSRYVIVVENQKKKMDEGAKAGKKKRQGGKKKTKKNFTCDICREVVDNEEELEGHRKSKHINEKSEFFCDFCLKVFKTKAILKGHRYKHVTDPQYLCVRCGKKYFTISNLNEHSLYCLDEKKFECPVCYKKFNVNKQFKRHLVIHEADRYIKCTVCDQTFSRKDNYRQHFRRHTGEKPYTCDICGKSFRIKATYNYHRRTHKDVRVSDPEGHKTDNADGELKKEGCDGSFQNPAFGNGEYPYRRDQEVTEKQINREYVERLTSEFPGSFLRKESYQERRPPDPYWHLPPTE